MGMKIKGKLAAEMSTKDLEALASQSGKAGDRARTEIKKRTGKELPRPPKGEKAEKSADAAEDQGSEAA